MVDFANRVVMRFEIIKIQSLSLKGHGVGEGSDGITFFVPGAYPGDKVKVSVLEAVNESYYEVSSDYEFIEKSMDRVASPCEYFGTCGGCDYLNLSYKAQLAAKENSIHYAMNRIALIPECRLPILAADKALHYRSRVQVRSLGGSLGFYKKKSHDLVDVKQCIMMHPQVDAKYQELRLQKMNASSLQKFEIGMDEQGEVAVYTNQAHGEAGFRQIHSDQNAKLQLLVASWIQEAEAKNVLECYAGNGNLTQGYHSVVNSVLAIEANPFAVKQGEEKFKLNPQVSFKEAFINKKIAVQVHAWNRMLHDTLLLDPPRSGTQGALKVLLHSNLKNIIYVSCSLESFIEDASFLKKNFKLKKLQGIDMFPQTRHVELVAWFQQ